jgi:hypothetical protein
MIQYITIAYDWEKLGGQADNVVTLLGVLFGTYNVDKMHCDEESMGFNLTPVSLQDMDMAWNLIHTISYLIEGVVLYFDADVQLIAL